MFDVAVVSVGKNAAVGHGVLQQISRPKYTLGLLGGVGCLLAGVGLIFGKLVRPGRFWTSLFLSPRLLRMPSKPVYKDDAIIVSEPILQ
jgi:hypothetical protein